MPLPSLTATRRARHRAVRHLRFAQAAVLASALVSCDAITGPALERTELASLAFGTISAVADSSAIVLVARPRSIQFRLAPDERIPITVSTSSGDVERVLLFDEAGGQGTPWDGYFSRVAFLVAANPGTAEALDHRLRQRGLVPAPVTNSPNARLAISFDPGRIVDAVEEVSRWPEVDFVDFEYGRFFTFGTPNGLAGPLRTAFGVPRAGDGVLQVAPGDTLFARYAQPSGGTLRASQPVEGATP